LLTEMQRLQDLEKETMNVWQPLSIPWTTELTSCNYFTLSFTYQSARVYYDHDPPAVFIETWLIRSEAVVVATPPPNMPICSKHFPNGGQQPLAISYVNSPMCIKCAW
jgi:hypothetical protein